MKWKLKRPAAAQRLAGFLNLAPAPASYRLEADGNEASLYFYDFIGEDWLGEGETAKKLMRDLDALDDFRTLNIYINSPGGDVFQGVTIFNILDRVQAEKIVHIDGLAASIASVIAMVGDEIRIAANAMIMIHDPWSFAMGSADELRKTADVLDKIRDTIAGTYERRTGGDRDEIVAWMGEETWMDADEAVERGFADAVVEPAKAENLEAFDLRAMGFKHLPEVYVGIDLSTKRKPADSARPMVDGDLEPNQAAGRRRHPAVARAAVAVAALRNLKPGSPAQ